MRGLCAAAAVVLILAIVLGGGTRAGFLADVVVQIAASILLCLATWRWAGSPRGAIGKLGWIMLVTLAGLLVLQLAPIFPGLAPDIAAPLPAGSPEISSDGRWRLSWAPQATWTAVASLIVPLAILGAVAQLDLSGRLLLWRIVLGLGIAAVVLGFLQVAQGPDSSLRFFEVTNPTDAVGFFANRNHFAAQLYITLAFAAVWISAAARALTRRGALKTATALSIAGASALLIVITVGLALARSRAGLILAMPAVVGIGAMALVAAPREGGVPRARWSSARTVLLALGVAVLVAAQFGLARVATRFDGGHVLDDLRVPLNITTFQTAWSALPFGTGLGSFVPVYATVEKPADAFAGYANRAHNDLAELLLETGIVGLALLILFLVWYIPRAIRAWRAPAVDADPAGVDLERAATLVIALVLAHSLVDYPLRTTAVSALFSFACALLVPPPPPREAPARTSGDSSAARRPRPPPLFSEPALPDPAAPKGEVGAWNDKIEWPDAWKSDR